MKFLTYSIMILTLLKGALAIAAPDNFTYEIQIAGESTYCASVSKYSGRCNHFKPYYYDADGSPVAKINEGIEYMGDPSGPNFVVDTFAENRCALGLLSEIDIPRKYSGRGYSNHGSTYARIRYLLKIRIKENMAKRIRKYASYASVACPLSIVVDVDNDKVKTVSLCAEDASNASKKSNSTGAPNTYTPRR